ncbi:DUF1471 domain-containing protein [Klebsiella variicola]
MKNTIMTLFISSLIMSFTANAETITGYGYSIDSAENMIKEKAKEKGFSGYKITSARMGNYTMMNAELIK